MTVAVWKVTGRDWWAHLHEAADNLEPEMRDAFLEEVEGLRRRVDVDALALAVEAGNAAGAAAIVSQGTGEAAQAVAGRLVDVIEQVAAAQSPASFGLTFDAINEQAVRWASRRSAQMVTAVSSETRQAIRDVVTQAVRGRLVGPTDVPRSDPRSQARVIRQLIGLTARDATAVQRYYAGMIQSPDVSERFAERQAAQRADRYLNRRALTIARNETMQAANAGQDLLWRQAADQGLIDRRRARRVWIVTRDDRLCEGCVPMRDVEVGFEQEFRSDEVAVGLRQRGRGVSFDSTKPRTSPVVVRHPPLHVQCRCALGLRFDL